MIEDKLKQLPLSPGVYKHLGINGEILYVGKAKNLKNRVRSYFVKSHSTKVQRLIQEVVDIEWIITRNETEALLLELNLIKEHRPKFNVLMTDDKTYPYIHITNHKHPKIEVVRRIKNKKGKFFGPYPDGTGAREIVKILDRVFKLRKCNTLPNKECLYYHINQCFAPCILKVDKNQYATTIKELTDFLNGKTEAVVSSLSKKMFAASAKMDFERAADYKNILQKIEELQTRQKIISATTEDADYISFYENNGYIVFYILFVRKGKLMATFDKAFSLFGDKKDALISFIATFYETNEIPKNVYVPIPLDSLNVNANLIVPQRGPRKQLIDMASNNAEESYSVAVNVMLNNEKKTFGAVVNLGQILKIKTPKVIEAIDNSHMSGMNYVSALAVYINGQPSKKDFRKYNLNLDKNDDYAAMREVIIRRYQKMEKYPDLLLVDGGKGQVSVALRALHEVGASIPVAGIVKDEKHKTRGLIGSDGTEIRLDKRSVEFLLLCRIQDDVHKYSIVHQASRNKKTMFSSLFDSVSGLGPTRQRALLKKFKSVQNIKNASKDELCTVIPERIVDKLLEVIKGK